VGWRGEGTVGEDIKSIVGPEFGIEFWAFGLRPIVSQPGGFPQRN